MSLRKDGSWLRVQRLMEIAKEIAKHFNDGGKCNFETLMLWVEFKIGLTETRARDYIITVVRAKQWEIQDGFILPGEMEK